MNKLDKFNEVYSKIIMEMNEADKKFSKKEIQKDIPTIEGVKEINFNSKLNFLQKIKTHVENEYGDVLQVYINKIKDETENNDSSSNTSDEQDFKNANIIFFTKTFYDDSDFDYIVVHYIKEGNKIKFEYDTNDGTTPQRLGYYQKPDLVIHMCKNIMIDYGPLDTWFQVKGI